MNATNVERLFRVRFTNGFADVEASHGTPCPTDGSAVDDSGVRSFLVGQRAAVVQIEKYNAGSVQALEKRVAGLIGKADSIVFECPLGFNGAVRTAVEAALGADKVVTLREPPGARQRVRPAETRQFVLTGLQVLPGDMMGVGHLPFGGGLLSAADRKK